MALTNKQILGQIEKFSKEFLAKLDRFGTTVAINRPTIVTTALIESTLSTISTTLSSILTSTNVNLTSLNEIESELEVDTKNRQNNIVNNVQDVEDILAIMDTVLDNILTKNTEIDTALDTIDGVLDNSLTKQTEIDTVLDVIKIGVDDMNSELDSIDDNWNLLSVNNIALVAAAASLVSIDSNTDGIEGKLDSIEGDLETIATNTSNLSSRNYGYVADFDVTGIGGGTTVTVQIQVPTDQRLHDVSIRIVYTGAGTNSLSVLERHTSSGTTTKTIKSKVITAGVAEHLPDPLNTSALEFDGNADWNVKGLHEIFISMTLAAVGDKLFVAVGAKCALTTLPTIDTTASTATITTNTDEDDID